MRVADPWHAALIITTSGAQTSIPATHRASTLDIIYTLDIYTPDIYGPDIYTPDIWTDK